MKKTATLLGLFAALSIPALADTQCTDASSFGSVVSDNVVVPDGQECFLFGVTISGNLTVGNGAELIAVGSDAVTGNVQIGKNASIIMDGVTIRGNLSVAQGSTLLMSAPGNSVSTVGGNLQVQDAALIELSGMQVNGEVQVGGHGDTQLNVYGMTVGKNMQVQSAAGLCLTSVTVNGNFQLQQTTGVPNGPCQQFSTANLICNSSFAGNGQLQQNTGDLVIGASGANYCGVGPVRFGGNLTLQQNGNVALDNTTVNGNLSCQQNMSVTQVNGASDDIVTGKTSCPGVVSLK